MRMFRGRNWEWHDIVVFALAAAIVYPDKLLVWVGEKTGQEFTRNHAILAGSASLGLLAVTSLALAHHASHFVWWSPLLHIGGLAFIRWLSWMLRDLLGY